MLKEPLLFDLLTAERGGTTIEGRGMLLLDLLLTDLSADIDGSSGGALEFESALEAATPTGMTGI